MIKWPSSFPPGELWACRKSCLWLPAPFFNGFTRFCSSYSLSLLYSWLKSDFFIIWSLTLLSAYMVFNSSISSFLFDLSICKLRISSSIMKSEIYFSIDFPPGLDFLTGTTTFWMPVSASPGTAPRLFFRGRIGRPSLLRLRSIICSLVIIFSSFSSLTIIFSRTSLVLYYGGSGNSGRLSFSYFLKFLYLSTCLRWNM